MRANKVDMKVNNDLCFESLFSFELRTMTSLLVRHLSTVDRAINDNIDDESKVIAMFILIDYINTHDFINFNLNNSKSEVFPYLPCILLVDRKERLRLVKETELDYATNCAIFFVRDVNVLRGVYDFIVDTKCLGSDTNTFIYYLRCVYDNLYNLYKSQVRIHLNDIATAEIESRLFYPEFISLDKLSNYTAEDEYDEIMHNNGFNISIKNFERYIPLLSTFGAFGSEDRIKCKLGELSGPIIGEPVNLSTIFPFNVEYDGKFVRNIKWK